MMFADHLTLDAPRRTADGYMAVRAKAARTGVYAYTGREVDPDNAHGLRDQASVNVLRDDAAVFDRASIHSFVGKPITDDHPTEAVTAGNWRDHGRGVVMGAIRDGDHVAFDLILMDAATIAKVDAGKVELSNGYSAKLEFGDFAAADGTKCPVRQQSIVGNHVAIVDRGRAGATCRIGDAALCATAPSIILDSLSTKEKPVSRTLTVDGLPVNVADADAATATINRLMEQRDAATAKNTTDAATIATLTTEKATLDAKVTTLEQAVKDAKPTPAQLRDAGKALMLTGARAKALGIAVTDEMDEDGIRAATVNAKMGDAAKDWNADQIAASFAVLTKDAKVDAGSGIVPLNAPVVMGDARQVRDAALAKANDDRRNAYKGSN